MDTTGCIIEEGNVERVAMFPGFWRQTLVHSDALMLCLFRSKAGAVLPEHRHVHEQAGYVISGSVELTVSGKTSITRAGASYFVPSNELHSAKVLEDAVVVDAFTPARQEYV